MTAASSGFIVFQPRGSLIAKECCSGLWVTADTHAVGHETVATFLG